MKWPDETARTRRWAPSPPFTVGVLTYRVAAGSKGDYDLRLEVETPSGWRSVFMEQVFMEADFFQENEQWLERIRDHWRKPGGSYFMDELGSAMRDGWQTPANRLRRQTGREALPPGPGRLRALETGGSSDATPREKGTP